MTETNSVVSDLLVAGFVLAALLTWAITSWQRHRDHDRRWARAHRFPVSATGTWGVPQPPRVPVGAAGFPYTAACPPFTRGNPALHDRMTNARPQLSSGRGAGTDERTG